jgi:hypothetical protein
MSKFIPFSLPLACVFAGSLLAGAAFAGTPLSEAQQRYRQERAACMDGSSNQDRATCLKEAGAALQEAKRDGLATAAEARLAQNRTARCQGLPAQEREDCALRMEQGKASGTAQQGGILREHVTTVPSR